MTNLNVMKFILMYVLCLFTFNFLFEGVRGPDITTGFPVNGNQQSVYQPSQQQIFAPAPGTYTPDIYR